MSHALVEIPRADWAKLLDMYVTRKTESTGYQMLQNFISWKDQDPIANADLKIYSLDNDWQQDGTFIVSDSQYCFNTLSDNLERLTTLLNCLTKHSSYILGGFPDRLMPAVEAHFKCAGYAPELLHFDVTVWHHISREEALKFSVDIPSGLSLRRLDVSNAPQVNSVWPHRSPNSVVFVERMIKYNDSVGVFDQQGILMAWCLRLPLGSLGLLQVEEAYKRQGLGSLVVCYLSKLIAEKGEEVCAPVIVANVASRGMFAKLGFKIIDKVHWAGKSKQQDI